MHIYDLGVVAAVKYAFDMVGISECDHVWVQWKTCPACASHHLLWQAGFKEQGW